MSTLFDLRKTMEMQQHHEISAASLAKMAGVSRQQYRRYEMGKSVPDLLVASRLAMCLNVHLSELVGIIRETVDHKNDPSLFGT